MKLRLEQIGPPENGQVRRVHVRQRRMVRNPEHDLVRHGTAKSFNLQVKMLEDGSIRSVFQITDTQQGLLDQNKLLLA